jgi:5'-nucleotidase
MPIARSLCAALVSMLAAACGPQRSAQTGHAADRTVVDVRIVAINDLHGYVEPASGQSGQVSAGGKAVAAGGAAWLASHVHALQAGHPNNVFVGAGDLIGASPLLSALLHDEPTIASLDLMGLQLSSVGNHEFDEGVTELRRMQQGGCHPEDGCKAGPFGGAKFRYLAANVIDKSTGRPLFPPYEIRAFRRTKAAFVGVTTRATASHTMPRNVEGLEFRDEAETVNALVPELSKQGVRAIVVLMHEGGTTTSDFDACENPSGAGFDIVKRMDPAVRVVVTGHTHAAYNCKLDGRIVTSAGSYGRMLSVIDLSMDEGTGEVISADAHNVIATHEVAPDAAQTALLGRYRKIAAPITDRVVGTIAQDLTRNGNEAGETPLGDVVADAQLAATRQQGAQIALTNPFGIRTDLIRDQQSAGETQGQITYAEAFAVQPFGNALVTMTLTGAQLDTVLEQQWSQATQILALSKGLTYVWKASNPVGDRVSDIRLEGVPVEAAGKVRVTVNTFLASGGDRFKVFWEGTDRVESGSDVVALTAFIAAHSPLSAPPLDRVKRVP